MMGRIGAAITLALAACAPVYSGSAAPATEETPRARPAAAEAPDPALVDVLATLVWPLATADGGILASAYGERTDPRGGDPRFHGGLDLRAPGGTPVYAAADAIVTKSEWSGAYGNVVVLDHGGGLTTLYAHHRENLVRAGERVRRGQPIGLVGRTGNATGDHLHFEVRWKDGTVDPRTVLPLLGTSDAR